LQEQRERIQQFTLASETRSKRATEQNYVRYEGMITRIFKVTDLFSTDADEDRHECLEQIDVMGIADEETQYENESLLKQTKRKKQTKKEKEATQHAIKRQKNLLLSRDIYERCLLDFQAPLSSDNMDLSTALNGILPSNEVTKKRYIMGKDQHVMTNKQRIQFLISKKKESFFNNLLENDIEVFTQKNIQDLRQRSRYKIHFEMTRYIVTKCKEEEIPQEENENEKKKEDSFKDVVMSRNKTLQNRYKTLIPDIDLPKEQFYEAEEQFADRIVFVGYFNEIPCFGEFFVLMCERRFNAKNKQINLVRSRQYNKTRPCDLDLNLLSEVYKQVFGDKMVTSMSTVFQGLDVEIARKANANTNQINSVIFDLIDPDISIDRNTDFRKLFLHSDYLQRKFISEIKPFFSDNCIRIFETLNPVVMFDLLRMVKRTPLNLCFFWLYPKDVQLAFMSCDNKQTADLLELNEEQYENIMTFQNRDYKILPEYLQMIRFYQTEIREMHAKWRGCTYFLKEDFSNESVIKLLVQNKILVDVKEKECKCSLRNNNSFSIYWSSRSMLCNSSSPRLSSL